MSIFGTNILDLPPAGTITGDEVMAVVQNGVTRRTTTSNVASGAGGTVTSVSVTGSADINSIGSPITTTGSIALSLIATGVTAGSYTNANITVDAKGRVTVASSGITPDPAFSSITSGTNTTAAMVVGSGASISATGSGAISATSVPASGIGAGTASISITGNSGTVTTINGMISAGTNVSITGLGTSGSPYVINAAGSGDVVGPASSTDNAIARYDGTTGKLIQDSSVTLGDAGAFTWNGTDTLNGTSAGTLNWYTPYAGNVTFTQAQSGQYLSFNLVTAEGKNAGFVHYDTANALGRLFRIYSQPAVTMSFAPSGTELLSLDGNGVTTATSNANWTITTPSASGIPLVIKGASAQSQPYFEIQDSSSTVIANITSNGDMNLRGTYPSYTINPTGWGGTYFYFQSGVNVSGTASGDYTLFLNPASKGFSFALGNVATTGKYGFVVTTAARFVIGSATASAKFHVVNEDASTVGQMITLAAAQSAKAFTIQNSSSVDLAYFDASANLFIGNSTTASTSTPTTLNMGGTYADTVTSSKAKWKLYYDGTDIQTYGIGISAGQMNFFKYTGGSYKWYFSDVEKMGLDSDGLITASKTYLTSSFSAGNPIFKITATNDAGTSPYIMEVVTSSGNTMFGLSENSGNNKGVLYGIESIQGMSTIALSGSSVNSGAAINVASSNLTMGWYGAGTYSFIDSYSSVLAINSWQNTDVVISGTTAGAKLQVNTVSASKKGVLIKMAATPTANPFEIQDSSSVARFYVASDFTWKQVTTSGHLNNIIDSSTGFEGGFIFKTNGTDKWQLYNAAGVNFGIYNYGLAAAALTIQGSTNDITLGGALTVNGALTLSGSPAFACGTITSTNAANNNMILQSGATSEAGILFKASSTTKWQLYANNNDSSFRFYSFDLSKELMQCSSGGTWTFVSGSASAKAMIVKLSASQTANAFEIQNSAGTTLASISKDGIIDVSAIWCDGSQVFDTSGGLLDIGSAGGFTQAVLLQGASGSIVKLGGSTSSFPAIKQSGAAITFRLADDSANCDITARDITARSAFWTRTATATSVSSAGETIIGVTSTAAARTITLSTADVDAGRIIYIKDESGGAGTNNITIDTQGSELIDGAASITISVNYGVAKLYCDGTNWYTL